MGCTESEDIGTQSLKKKRERALLPKTPQRFLEGIWQESLFVDCSQEPLEDRPGVAAAIPWKMLELKFHPGFPNGSDLSPSSQDSDASPSSNCQTAGEPYRGSVSSLAGCYGNRKPGGPLSFLSLFAGKTG